MANQPTNSLTPEQQARLNQILDRFDTNEIDCGPRTEQDIKFLLDLIRDLLTCAPAPSLATGPTDYQLRVQADNIVEGVFSGVERQAIGAAKMLQLRENIQVALRAAFRSGSPSLATAIEKVRAMQDEYEQKYRESVTDDVVRLRAAYGNCLSLVIAELTALQGEGPAVDPVADIRECDKCDLCEDHID